MADNTGISWTDATWNPMVGCSIKSPGCRLCYAMREAHRMGENPKLLGKYQGLTTIAANGRPVWNGVVRLHAPALIQPIRWARPRLIFVNSMSDLFHETVPWTDIDKVFAVVLLASQHTFQFLTKRSAEMRGYMNDPNTHHRVQTAAINFAAENGLDAGPAMQVPWPPPNAHMGVSTERQPEANERVYDLVMTKAAVRWVSGEPLLSAIDYTRISLLGRVVPLNWSKRTLCLNALTGRVVDERSGEVMQDGYSVIDGIVVGGENDERLGGTIATPLHPDWVLSILDQCETHGTGFHFKQWGSWLPLKRGYLPHVRAQAAVDIGGDWIAHYVGKKEAGHMLGGKAYQNWPMPAEVKP